MAFIISFLVIAVSAAVVILFAGSDWFWYVIPTSVVPLSCLLVYTKMIVPMYYYVNVTIRSLRGGASLSRETERARRAIRHDSVTSTYELYYRNSKTRAPNIDSLEIGKRGGVYLDLLEIEDNVFIPLATTDLKKLKKTTTIIEDPITHEKKEVITEIPDPTITTVGQQDLHWAAEEMEKAITDTAEKPNPWMQHAPMIGVIVLGAMILIGMTVIFPAIQSTAATANSACTKGMEYQQQAINVLNETCSKFSSYISPITTFPNGTY